MINVMLIGNGFDIQHDINIKFKDFVNSNVFRKGITKSYSRLFSDAEYNDFSDSSELWSEFEEYLKYVAESNDLKPKYFIKRITILFQKWFKSKK